MSPSFARAQMLRQHRRHEEAVALLHEHLAHHPEDPGAFIELALNRLEIPGAKALALEDARRASGLLPEDSFPLALQSRILSMLDREKEALPLAESAIALDPEDTYSWNAKTLALAGLHRWAEAEQSARQALVVDPDDESASNLLAHVLRLQNKLEESEQESRRRLERDPENAFSFANSGWAALQRRQVKDAENYFKEALRLDPEMGYAKEGLKQSYKARSGFYRLFLRWAFFLQRFSEKHRTMILIGVYFGFRIVRAIAEAVNPILAVPVVIAYFLLLFGTWLSSGIANLLILKDPVARMSLDRGEKLEGIFVGSFFIGGVALLIGGMASGLMPLAIAGGTLMAASIPASLVFTNESKTGRWLFGTCLAVVLALGGFVVFAMSSQASYDAWKDKTGAAITIALLIVMGVTWLAMVPSLRKAKPE